MPASTDTVSKTAVRKVLGRGKFTVAAAATAYEVSAPTARKRVQALLDAGVIEQVENAQTGLRGRPAAQFRVLSGK